MCRSPSARWGRSATISSARSTRYDTAIAQRTRDVAAARAAFSARGISELTVHSAEVYEGMSAATELMVDQFAEAGVTLRVENADARVTTHDLAALTRRPLFRQHLPQPAVGGVAAVPDPAGTTWNLNGFTTPTYQTFLDAATSTNDGRPSSQSVPPPMQEILHSDGASVVWV